MVLWLKCHVGSLVIPTLTAQTHIFKQLTILVVSPPHIPCSCLLRGQTHGNRFYSVLFMLTVHLLLPIFCSLTHTQRTLNRSSLLLYCWVMKSEVCNLHAVSSNGLWMQSVHWINVTVLVSEHKLGVITGKALGTISNNGKSQSHTMQWKGQFNKD